MLDVKNVSFYYAEHRALADVSLEVKPHCTTAVLGLSGSGKTTLLNLLGALSDVDPKEGKITYRDATGKPVDYSGLTSDRLADLRRDEFGFVLQSAYMLPHFTCGQNIGMPLQLQQLPPDQIDARVGRILQLADPTGKLWQKKDQPARDVSGGEKQRMAVLRAMIHDPGVLFADEPLSSLDPVNAELIMQLLSDWRAGKLNRSQRRDRALVLVTHDIDVAWKYADEFAILHNGILHEGRLIQKHELRGPEDIRSRMKPVADPQVTPDEKEDRAAPAASVASDNRNSPFQFLRWFAWLNLWERQARRSTWVNILSVAVVVGFVIFTFGLAEGVDQARREKLRQDPLDLCFWIGSDVVQQPIDVRFKERIEMQLNAAIGSGPEERVHPFSTTELKWFDKSGRVIRRFDGRTVAVTDPILKSIPLRSRNRQFLDPQERGVIVTPDLLLQLGYEKEEYPESLNLEPPGGGKVKVKLLDVTSQDLPLSHAFAISEEYEARLRQENPNPVLSMVHVGPIPKDWPTVDKLPAEITEMFATYQLFPPAADESGDTVTWTLTHNGGGEVPALDTWKTYVQRINAALAQIDKPGGGKYTDRPELADLDPPPSGGEPKKREFHDYAGIYFSELEQLERAIPIFKQANVPLNQDIVHQLTSIGQQTQAVVAVLSILAIAIAVVVLFNMVLIQVLRNEQKISEIGMLKAMGMTTGSLGRLADVESAMLWFCGTLFGMLAASLAGPAIAFLGSLFGGEQIPAGFAHRPGLILFTAGLSLVACVVANRVATRRSRRAPPSQSLRNGS